MTTIPCPRCNGTGDAPGQLFRTPVGTMNRTTVCRMCAGSGEADTPPLVCAFCPATVPDVDTAINAGWEPSYFDGDIEMAVPVCPACQRTRLRPTAGGPLELIPAPLTPTDGVLRELGAAIESAYADARWAETFLRTALECDTPSILDMIVVLSRIASVVRTLDGVRS